MVCIYHNSSPLWFLLFYRVCLFAESCVSVSSCCWAPGGGMESSNVVTTTSSCCSMLEEMRLPKAVLEGSQETMRFWEGKQRRWGHRRCFRLSFLLEVKAQQAMAGFWQGTAGYKEGVAGKALVSWITAFAVKNCWPEKCCTPEGLEGRKEFDKNLVSLFRRHCTKYKEDGSSTQRTKYQSRHWSKKSVCGFLCFFFGGGMKQACRRAEQREIAQRNCIKETCRKWSPISIYRHPWIKFSAHRHTHGHHLCLASLSQCQASLCIPFTER